ncbi:ribonucleotide reductase subunit alpha [Marinicella rhabdoformis]|uniref:ribonucleotide reductase subunit alpha n=1 Tax=Marinicella rhabdoformis TaxID=2580566 RepID=UPI0012AEBBC8|nr:ribonucleotide reductase subunit alpha [Marinicella rhabdoformis]
MEITNYDTLLKAAKQQPEPQRFLFVFVSKSLADDHNEAQAEKFKAGLGGELTPVMTVDKPLDELSSFDALVAESELLQKPWDMVLVGCLSGQNGVMPTAEDSMKHLEAMMKTVEMGGTLSKYMVFDKSGTPLLFS